MGPVHNFHHTEVCQAQGDPQVRDPVPNPTGSIPDDDQRLCLGNPQLLQPQCEEQEEIVGRLYRAVIEHVALAFLFSLGINGINREELGSTLLHGILPRRRLPQPSLVDAQAQPSPVHAYHRPFARQRSRVEDRDLLQMSRRLPLPQCDARKVPHQTPHGFLRQSDLPTCKPLRGFCV
jgi:hypothetical protein